MYVYLAGPVAGCSYAEATDWRRDVADVLEDVGYTVLSPMRGKDFLKGCPALSPLCEPDFLLSSPHAVVARDANDVARCDVMLVNLLGAESVSIGSMMEMAWAWWLRKYIIVVMGPENPHQHGFVRQCASLVVESMADAYHYLRVFYPK
jgi:nucleoside 2-deoxyribosyltransferase